MLTQSIDKKYGVISKNYVWLSFFPFPVSSAVIMVIMLSIRSSLVAMQIAVGMPKKIDFGFLYTVLWACVFPLLTITAMAFLFFDDDNIFALIVAVISIFMQILFFGISWVKIVDSREILNDLKNG